MAITLTVSLTFLSMLTIAGTDAISKVWCSPITPTSPNPLTAGPSSDSANSASGSRSAESTPRSSTSSQPSTDAEEESYGLWTISELRPHSQSHSRCPSSPPRVVRQRTEDDDGLPSYAHALASPPRMGLKSVRIVLGEERAPPGYEDVVRGSPARHSGRR